MSAGLNDGILADDGVFDRCAVLDHRAGHQHAVEHLGVFADIRRIGQHGIFDLALDDAALGDDGVDNARILACVMRRHTDRS